MERNRVFARRLEPVSLLGEDVQQHRSLDVFDEFQVFAEGEQVVAVDRADVPEAELFKQHSAWIKDLNASFICTSTFSAGSPTSGTLLSSQATSFFSPCRTERRERDQIAGQSAHARQIPFCCR